MSDQEALWRDESTAWYRRNKDALLPAKMAVDDPIAILLGRCDLHPQRILDVGCADGWRCFWLVARYHCEGFGVDISSEAITEGSRLYPNLTLRCTSVMQLPFASECMSLIVSSFVFHCLARDRLLNVVAEIDRVLMPGGHLILADFSPDVASKRPWKHRDGIWTYKLPDAGAWLFRSSENYRYVDSLTFDHDTHEIAENVRSEKRAKVVLLQKRECYQEQAV